MRIPNSSLHPREKRINWYALVIVLLFLLYSLKGDGTEGMGLTLLLPLLGALIAYKFFLKFMGRTKKIVGNTEEGSNSSETEGTEVPKTTLDHTPDDPLDE